MCAESTLRSDYESGLVGTRVHFSSFVDHFGLLCNVVKETLAFTGVSGYITARFSDGMGTLSRSHSNERAALITTGKAP